MPLTYHACNSRQNFLPYFKIVCWHHGSCWNSFRAACSPIARLPRVSSPWVTQLFFAYHPATAVAWTLPAQSRLRTISKITAPFCWRVSHSVTHKHELWIWFTLSYAMMKALLRLAAVRDTKQAGEFRGDTVHFIASSSALFLTQNGNIYRPLKQTATFLLRLNSSKQIAENS